MSVIANRVKMSTSTIGTGTIDLDAAETGYQSFADGGITNGQVVSYAIEDGAAWEIGTGTYTTGTPDTLSRTVIESSNSDAAIPLSGSAVVFITAISGDLQNAVDMDQGVATTDSPSFAGLSATGDVDIADKIVHTGDTNTSIRFPAADTVTVETAGTERVRVDSSGNVGIGTSSPSTNLDINGTIKATNVSDGTLSIPTTYVTNGSAKAWVNFDGTAGTLAPRNSLNVSSLTDNGTGDYTVSFSSAFGAADYAAHAQGSGNNDTISLPIKEGTTPTSSSFRSLFINTALTSAVDSLYVFSAVHGDLA